MLDPTNDSVSDIPSAEDVNNLLDIELFRAWLKIWAFADEIVGRQAVGYCNQIERCPLARYLFDSGLDAPMVALESVWAAGRFEPVAHLPHWASTFMYRVDALGGGGTPLWAKDCLRALDNLP